MKRPTALNPVSISCIYAITAITWILFSDTIVHGMGFSPVSTYRVSLIKGVAFVVLTSLLLFSLVRKMLRQIKQDRAEHEAELLESEERFSTAFNSSPDGMAISSLRDGTYIEVNQAFLAQLGYERSEVIGHSGVELGIWVDPIVRESFARSLQEGDRVRGANVNLRRKNGQIIEIEVSAGEIHLHGSSYLLVIGRDVSVQKRLERQFLQAQKMEALGQFAAGIAHDFKNLLMLIRGFTDLIDVSTPKNVEYRNQVFGAVDKADTLTRQLLAYSRKQEASPELLDLNSVVSDITNLLPKMVPKSIRVFCTLGPELWPVMADRGQLEQVLMNLAVNAQDAMPRGGSFEFVTSNVTLGENCMSADNVIVPAADYVEILAKDSGCGIAPELIGKIFDPFFTTKERGKGTGLGLAAVYGVVKQSHGFLLVRSRPGDGTVFQILLPRSLEPHDKRAHPLIRAGRS